MAMRDLLAAEWLKLRTTRLLYGMAAATVLLSVAAVAGAVLAADRSGVPLSSTEGLERVLPVTGTGALVVLLAGTLIAAGEHRHGTANGIFLTTPRRYRVVLAKLAIGAWVGLGAGLVTAAACVATAASLFSTKGASFPFGDHDVWLIVAGTLAYTTLFAVLGVALGTLIRNQVLAVAVALAWIGIVEHILVSLAPGVGRWLPAAAGQAIVRTPLDDLLSPGAGLVLLAGYAVVIAAAGVRFTVSRDV
jgi:ABC-2 type transport system permease protein